LNVVESHENRAALGQGAHRIQDGQPDRVRIGRLWSRLDAQQGDLERTPARRQQRSGDVVEDGGEQVREARERQ
jgi:hypothetical protein